LSNNIVYVQYMSRTILSMYTTCPKQHYQKCNSFWFFINRESEQRWFFFGGFLFLDGECGGGDSWPMTNLATWCLPVGWITSLFMNHNNCSYTVMILCGVRYYLLRSISCNFKNQRSEVSSMYLGIKMQNKPHMY
jgi:hypothetical protein